MRGISCLAANQLAAQEGLCTMEWVSIVIEAFPRHVFQILPLQGCFATNWLCLIVRLIQEWRLFCKIFENNLSSFLSKHYIMWYIYVCIHYIKYLDYCQEQTYVWKERSSEDNQKESTAFTAESHYRPNWVQMVGRSTDVRAKFPSIQIMYTGTELVCSHVHMVNTHVHTQRVTIMF